MSTGNFGLSERTLRTPLRLPQSVRSITRTVRRQLIKNLSRRRKFQSAVLICFFSRCETVDVFVFNPSGEKSRPPISSTVHRFFPNRVKHERPNVQPATLSVSQSVSQSTNQPTSERNKPRKQASKQRTNHGNGQSDGHVAGYGWPKSRRQCKREERTQFIPTKHMRRI